MQAIRYDCGCVDETSCYITPEGYIKGTAIVTRTGVFNYMNADGSTRRELRLPENVFNEDSLQSMKMIPITNGHPSVRLVDAKNAKDLVIGFTGDSIGSQGDYVKTNFVITHEDGVKAVKDMGRKQLSLGYTVDLLPETGLYDGQSYDYIQKNIKYNHLAIVDSARAGSEARINLDSCDAFEIQGELKMTTKRKIKLDAMETWVEPEVADWVEGAQGREKDHESERTRLEADVKNLRDERDRVMAELARAESELEFMHGENDKLSAERDSMKDMDMKMDSDDFKTAVNNRVKLYEVAKSYLHKEELTRLDGLSDLDIKKKIVSICKKSISLDGKSDIYVETLFDVVMSDQKQNVNVSNVKKSDINTDQADRDPTLARQLMMKRQQEACKNKPTPAK